jgi:hypothetical protein
MALKTISAFNRSKAYQPRMISNDQDEDADILDDETLLENYLGTDAPKPPAGTDGAACMADWPPSRGRDLGLHLDAETLAWFQARYVDWRSTIAGVLQAWVAAQTRPRPDPQRTADIAHPSPTEAPPAPGPTSEAV